MKRPLSFAPSKLKFHPSLNRERFHVTIKFWFVIVVILIFIWVEIFNQQLVKILDSNASSITTTSKALPPMTSPGQRINSLPLSTLTERYSHLHFRPAMPQTEASPDPECGTPPSFQSYFQQDQMFRSSRNEDRSIYELLFLNAKNTSSYVELGAFNGKRESNTRFFDLCLKWNGLLIEANPMKYPKLLENRPHAHCLNYAPSCNRLKEIAFHSVSFTNAAQADVANNYDNTSLTNVPCDQLTPVLVDVLGGQVTFFSLDVEGAENQVLRTVDFSKIKVDIWMVENVNQFCQRDQRCESRDESRAILQRAGYVGYADIVLGSDLFVLPNSQYDKILTSRYDPSTHRIVLMRMVR